MSDLSGGALVVLAFALVYLGVLWRHRLLNYCAAILMGLCLSIQALVIILRPIC